MIKFNLTTKNAKASDEVWEMQTFVQHTLVGSLKGTYNDLHRRLMIVGANLQSHTIAGAHVQEVWDI